MGSALNAIIPIIIVFVIFVVFILIPISILPRLMQNIITIEQKKILKRLFHLQNLDGETHENYSSIWFMEKNNFAGEGSIVIDIEEESGFSPINNIVWKYISFYDYNPNVFVRARLLPSPSIVYRSKITHRSASESDENSYDPIGWFNDLIRYFYLWNIELMNKEQFGILLGNGNNENYTDKFEDLERFIKRMYERTAYHLQNLYRGVRSIEERQKRYLIASDLYFTEMLISYLWPYLFTSAMKYNHNTGKRFWNLIRKIFTFFMLFTLNGSILTIGLTEMWRQIFKKLPVFRDFHVSSKIRTTILQLLNALSQTLSLFTSFISMLVLILSLIYPIILLYSHLFIKTSNFVANVVPLGMIILAYIVMGLAIGVSRSLRSQSIQILRYYYGIVNSWGESIFRPTMYLVIMGIAMSFFTGKIKWSEVYTILFVIVVIYVMMYILVHRVFNWLLLMFLSISVIVINIIIFYLKDTIPKVSYIISKISYVFSEIILGFAYFTSFSLSFSLNDIYHSWPRAIYKYEGNIQSHFDDKIISSSSNLPIVKITNYAGVYNNRENNNVSTDTTIIFGEAESCQKDTVPRIFYPYTCVRIQNQYDINFISFVVFMKIYVLIMLWFLFVSLKRKFMRL